MSADEILDNNEYEDILAVSENDDERSLGTAVCRVECRRAGTAVYEGERDGRLKTLISHILKL